MEKPKPKGKRKSFFYMLARVLAGILFHTVCPIVYHGTKHLALIAPYIIICNHLSWLDPICVAYAVKKEQVAFMAKKETMQNKLAGAILRNMHAIPVDRHNSDMSAMRLSMQALREGSVLGIFPEGTRHKRGNMEELEGGAAILALRSQAPVIPMYIHGKIKPFTKVHCYIGPPMVLEDLREQGVDKEVAQALLDRITALYRDMALQAQRA